MLILLLKRALKDETCTQLTRALTHKHTPASEEIMMSLLFKRPFWGCKGVLRVGHGTTAWH